MHWLSWVLLLGVLGMLAVLGIHGAFGLLRRAEPRHYFRCRHCQRKFRYGPEQAGHTAMCPCCRRPFTFPGTLQTVRKSAPAKSPWLQILQIAALFGLMGLGVAGWLNKQYGTWSPRVPEIDIDPLAREVGVHFSSWHWQGAYQLRCRISCDNSAFLQYGVHYVGYGPEGEKVGEGALHYPPLSAGENVEAAIDFQLERGKVRRVEIRLFKAAA